MIINTGSRTDTVQYYSDWLLKRFQEGFVYSRNPMFQNKVSVEIINLLFKLFIRKILSLSVTYVQILPLSSNDRKEIMEALKEILIKNEWFTKQEVEETFTPDVVKCIDECTRPRQDEIFNAFDGLKPQDVKGLWRTQYLHGFWRTECEPVLSLCFTFYLTYLTILSNNLMNTFFLMLFLKKTNTIFYNVSICQFVRNRHLAFPFF